MKYVVRIGAMYEYEFDNGDTAMRFAEVAKTHQVQDLPVDVIVTKEEENHE